MIEAADGYFVWALIASSRAIPRRWKAFWSRRRSWSLWRVLPIPAA